LFEGELSALRKSDSLPFGCGTATEGSFLALSRQHLCEKIVFDVFVLEGVIEG
jgi:hypothetical protein